MVGLRADSLVRERDWFFIRARLNISTASPKKKYCKKTNDSVEITTILPPQKVPEHIGFRSGASDIRPVFPSSRHTKCRISSHDLSNRTNFWDHQCHSWLGAAGPTPRVYGAGCARSFGGWGLGCFVFEGVVVLVIL